MSNYEVLKTSKAALDEGLINEGDYEAVKSSFLRAQQIKAGVDAGFIQEAEYHNVKRAFLTSLNLLPADSPGHESNGEKDGAPNSANGGTRPPSGTLFASPRPKALTPRPSPPPSRTATPPPAPPPPASGTSRVPSGAPSVASEGEEASTTANVPRNIPRMGGARPKQPSGTSMSGISVDEDAVNLYYYLKAKSTYRWATWRVNDAGKEVVIDNVGDKDSTFAEFVAVLPDADCRYGVFDFQFTNSEGCLFNKIVFVNWAPDAARIKAKMMFASTKDFFKGYLDGLSIELQASERSDLDEAEVINTVRASITRQ